MNILRQIFCRHELEFVRNIYGDEINLVGGRRSWWRCKKCGRWIAKPHLYSNETTMEEDVT